LPQVSAPRDLRPPDARGVAVVTDSTSYLPRRLLDRWAIREVSLYVGWHGVLRREDEYDDPAAFYARLRESRSLPATSQPSVGDFLACYEPLVGAGRDVVSVHLASGLSGTCESATEGARIVAERGYPGRVEVVDSLLHGGGTGARRPSGRRSPGRGHRARLRARRGQARFPSRDQRER